MAARCLAHASCVVALISCSQPPAPSETQRAIIVDGAHNGGTRGFYFLPPMVDAPTLEGPFDGNESPTVTIQEYYGAPPLAVFTTTSGIGDVVHVDWSGPSYVVEWHTRLFQFPYQPYWTTYQIVVSVGKKQLGIARS